MKKDMIFIKNMVMRFVRMGICRKHKTSIITVILAGLLVLAMSGPVLADSVTIDYNDISGLPDHDPIKPAVYDHLRFSTDSVKADDYRGDWSPSVAKAWGAKTVILYTGNAFTKTERSFNSGCKNLCKYMNNAAKMGIRVIVSVKCATQTNPDLDMLERMVKAVKDHPALGGWYIADEPVIRNFCGQPLTKVIKFYIDSYDLIKKYSNKPVYIAIQPKAVIKGDAAYLADAYDVLMTDRYPCISKSKEFETLGKWMREIPVIDNIAYSLGKDVWIVIQAQGYNKYHTRHRLPTKAEIRFMIYYSLTVRGLPLNNHIDGITFYNSHHLLNTPADNKDPYPYSGKDWLEDVGTPTMTELNSIISAITDGRIKDGVSDNQDNVFSLLCREPGGGDYYLITVNKSNSEKKVQYTIDDPPGFNKAQPEGLTWEILGSDPFVITNNTFTIELPAYGAAIFLLVM
jgi:hypothetical protein